MKNRINHCIEGITQCRPTHDIRMKALTGDHARGAQLTVAQRSTQTSCRARGAGGFHNSQRISDLCATTRRFVVLYVASWLKKRLRSGHEPCNTCIIIIMWLRSWCHVGIGNIPVRLEVLITWSRPNSDLQRVGSGLLKNHKNSLFV